MKYLFAVLCFPVCLWAQTWETDENLYQELSEKRIVALGESLHAVEEFSAAKIEWIEYLHEELGYNILAFEYGVGDAFLAGYYRNDWTAETMLKMGLYPCWQTETNLELMEYLKEHPELKLVGFDMQGEAITGEQPSFLEDFLQPIKRQKWVKKALEIEANLKSGTSTVEDYQWIQTNINKNLAKLNEYHTQEYIDYASYFVQTRIMTVVQDQIPNLGYDNRDSIMAENVKYLMEELYPSEKMIIWAHNMHIMKVPTELRGVSDANVEYDMGKRLDAFYGDDYYTIGFYHSLGTTKHQPWGDDFVFEEKRLPEVSFQYYFLEEFRTEKTKFLQVDDFKGQEDWNWMFEPCRDYFDGGISIWRGYRNYTDLGHAYDGLYWVKTVSTPDFIN